MQPSDVEAVIALECECGLKPRSEASLLNELQSDLAIRLVTPRTDSGDDSVGGVFGGTVVLDELQVDNLAVAPALRRRGIGASLLKAALALAAARGAIRAVLEVRAGNTAAQTLYRKFGFDVVATRRDYYQQPIEDAFVMVIDLTRLAEQPGFGGNA